MSKNVLITGGAGFIGSALTVQLAESGIAVRVLDNLSPQIHGKNPEQSYSFILIKNKAEFIRGDITLYKEWVKAIKGIDIIIHLAAETGTGQSMYSAGNYVKVNSLGTALMLDTLVHEVHQVKKVIFASSRAVYGEGKYRCGEHGVINPGPRKTSDLMKGIYDCLCPFCNEPLILLSTDEKTPTAPLSVYGITKLNQEQLIRLVCKSVNINSVSLRFQNVYGPGQSLSNPYTGILAVFSNLLKQNKKIDIFEDGLESRDFVYISDVITAVVKAVQKDLPDESHVINIGSGKRITVIEIAEMLKKALGSGSEIMVSGRYRTGDIRHNIADLTQASELLDYSPYVSFEEGIQSFCRWITSQDSPGNLYERSIRELEEKGLLK